MRSGATGHCCPGSHRYRVLENDRLPQELSRHAVSEFRLMTWVSIDLCVVPIGVGVSLSPFIAACQRQIAQSGLKSQLGPNGTAIEGPWDEVMACVHECHQELHRMGAPRIYTTLKINTRTDRDQSFEDKVNAVERCLKS